MKQKTWTTIVAIGALTSIALTGCSDQANESAADPATSGVAESAESEATSEESAVEADSTADGSDEAGEQVANSVSVGLCAQVDLSPLINALGSDLVITIGEDDDAGCNAYFSESEEEEMVAGGSQENLSYIEWQLMYQNSDEYSLKQMSEDLEYTEVGGREIVSDCNDDGVLYYPANFAAEGTVDGRLVELGIWGGWDTTCEQLSAVAVAFFEANP